MGSQRNWCAKTPQPKVTTQQRGPPARAGSAAVLLRAAAFAGRAARQRPSGDLRGLCRARGRRRRQSSVGGGALSVGWSAGAAKVCAGRIVFARPPLEPPLLAARRERSAATGTDSWRECYLFATLELEPPLFSSLRGPVGAAGPAWLQSLRNEPDVLALAQSAPRNSPALGASGAPMPTPTLSLRAQGRAFNRRLSLARPLQL